MYTFVLVTSPALLFLCLFCRPNSIGGIGGRLCSALLAVGIGGEASVQSNPYPSKLFFVTLGRGIISVYYDCITHERTVDIVVVKISTPQFTQLLGGQVFSNVVVLEPSRAVGCRPQPWHEQQQPHHNMSQSPCHFE